MIKVESVYVEEGEYKDKIKTQLEFDDKIDPILIFKECMATASCVARFAVLLNENISPSEFLRSVAVDIEEGNDLFANGFDREDVIDDEQE